MTRGFIEVDDSSVEGKGNRRTMSLPEPGRRDPAPSQGGAGVGPKSFDAPTGCRKGGHGAAASSLDYSNTHNRNSWCGNWTVAGPVHRDGVDSIGFAKQYCKAWHCRHCGPRKAARLQKAIRVHAAENSLTKFLTLTLDPKLIPDDLQEIKHSKKRVGQVQGVSTKKIWKIDFIYFSTGVS